MCPSRVRPRARLTLLTILLASATWLFAAPDSERMRTTGFTAEEISQGFTNQKVIALPQPSLRDTYDETAEATYAAAETAAGFELDRVYPLMNGLRVLRLPDGMSPAQARTQLLATGRYQFVDYNHIRERALVPTDPTFADGSQWHHRNTGQSGGTADADIDSTEAWDLRNDASNIIVAVVDDGIRLTHQDIAPNLWTNSAEIAGNGRDDDRNGYVDDVHGIDARDGTGNPTDDDGEGHGTHVAGIIGAAANNGVGGTGVAWRVQIMPLRFLGGTEGNGSDADAIECINYAVRHGAHVINASYGSGGFSQGEREAIRAARNAGIIFVTSAGNDGLDLDISAAYPANYPLDNILTVGNSTRLDDVSTTSNTGSGLVDLFAPGSEIMSLGVDSDTDTRVASGTSMSSPMVAGAVALLRAQYPQDGYRATINRLLRGVDRRVAFTGEAQSGGRLNVFNALTTSDTRPFNDDFADAAVLQGEIITVRNNSVGATAQAGEPSHAGRLRNSLWWAWTAPSSGIVQVDTRGSDGDTALAVYTGTSLNALTQIAQNDNEAPGFLTSRVSFTATLGTTYYIASDSFSAGLVILNLASAAANDAFASAQELTGDAPLITTTNASATREFGEPTIASGAAGQTLWYKWTAPHDGVFQASAYSESTDPMLGVFTGSTVTNLTRLGAADDTGPSGANVNALVQWTAVEDTTYFIAIDTYNGSDDGEITLSLTDALWQFATGAFDDDDPDARRPTITNVPTVGPDGIIYVSSSDAHFYAIRPDGTQLWRVATEGYSDSAAAALAPDGTILFGTRLGYLYGLNPDGSTRWSIGQDDAPFTAAPAVAADGTAYFKRDDGVLRAFSPDGTSLWSYSGATDGEGSYGGPAIAADGAILLPANDGALHCLNPSGTLRWRYLPQNAEGADDDSGIYTSPAIDGAGNIYVSTLQGTVFSLTSTGSLRWVFRTPEAGENVSSSIALGEGRAYFASYGAFLYALDQTDGTQVWRASIEAQARASSPAIAADGSIIVGSYANKLFRFDRDGNLLRSWSAGNWFRSSPALADGRIYIGNGDGKVYAFDLDGIEPAAGPEYPWPQYRHGQRHLGRATLEIIGRTVATDPVDPGRLVNLSVRNRTTRGTGVLTAGFVLSGPVGKPLVVRGIGPTLADFGVTGTVSETTLEVYRTADTSAALVSNSGWTSTTGDGRDLGAFPLPDGSADSVVRTSFGSEAYTAQLLPRTDDTAPGIGLVEIYDADIAELRTRLTNLSARTALAANGDVTLGFVLAGNSPRTVLIRAVGPGLDQFLNPATTLNDPQLTLLVGQTAETGNEDWRGLEQVRAAAETVGAFPLQNSSADAALVTTLPPGAYTARVTAPTNQTGIVLVEVYLLPEN
ncbi:S8 family serine peptidase [Actomonas aquatica]|uniref:S8 family serine peptidase n=1 Tax=Actomonas aquatica TaxID=2866162 RepID=A0ABZ1C8C0_9BACT|nr:S8 family serine peptidase [Opitutus sp. WL0086]WRQ87518.1 S8 family serine peptidase [Opitutus sp. WL0086]